MRWRDEDGPRFPSPPHSIPHIQPLGVDRHRHRTDAGRLQYLVHEPVARLLDPRGRPGVEQHACREVESLLRAAHDQDLRRFTMHRARRPQVVRDRLAQLRQPGWIAVLQSLHADVSRVARDQLRPNLDRKRVQVRLPDLERPEGRERRLLVRRHRRRKRRNRAHALWSADIPVCALTRAERTRNERPRSHPALEVPLGEQLRIRIDTGRRDTRSSRASSRVDGTICPARSSPCSTRRRNAS